MASWESADREKAFLAMTRPFDSEEIWVNFPERLLSLTFLPFYGISNLKISSEKLESISAIFKSRCL